jgi:type IV pilus assembly protein PilC
MVAKKKMPLSIGGVPRKQLVAFTRQLSTLQDAGLPILRSLQILEQQQKPGLLKAIIGGVADEVEGGGDHGGGRPAGRAHAD